MRLSYVFRFYDYRYTGVLYTYRYYDVGPLVTLLPYHIYIYIYIYSLKIAEIGRNT